MGQLTSEVAELAVDIRREFIVVGGDASMTDFTPGWIRERDGTLNVAVREAPEEEKATSGEPKRAIDWQNDTYYYIHQTFFDQGRVFARLKGCTLVEASKIWSALTVVSPRGGPGGLIRMVSWKSPHLHLPSAGEIQAGVTNASGDLIIERKRAVYIGLPIPGDDFSARIWLRREWNRFKKRLLDKEIERDDIDRYMVRLYRLFRKLRREAINDVSASHEWGDTDSDGPAEHEPGDDAKTVTGPEFPSLLPESQEVRDLCYKLRKELGEGRSQMAIARELTGESEGDDRRARSLLRQARRFPHLWKKSRRRRPEE